MSATTAISWTDSTWTPVRAMRLAPQEDGTVKRRIGWHCEHVSPGCVHCYSERLNTFVGTGQEFKPAHLVHVTSQGDVRGDVTVFLDEQMLTQPLRWQRGRHIFVCSMTDLFADFVSDETIDRVFAVMALAPQHTYQVLTKRAARMRAYFDNPIREALIGRQVGLLELARSGNPVAEWSGLPMPHVWLGVSAEDQQRADERIPELLATRAAVRYVSVEPMLGPVDLQASCTACCPNGDCEYDSHHKRRLVRDSEDGGAWVECACSRLNGLDWVICGTESGSKARGADIEWCRSLMLACREAGVAFHMKQITERGKPLPLDAWPEDLRVQEFPA